MSTKTAKFEVKFETWTNSFNCQGCCCHDDYTCEYLTITVDIDEEYENIQHYKPIIAKELIPHEDYYCCYYITIHKMTII